MKRLKNPFVFLEVSIGDDYAGKMVFELFADIVPKTAENFRALCTGEMGVGKTTKSPLYYRGTRFHLVMKGLIAQGGDFSKKDDENFVLRHDDRVLLSMANTGSNTNGSQFFITFKSAPHLDRKNTVFGKLIHGDDVLRKIEHVDVDGSSSPVVQVKIVNCGMHTESKNHGTMASENDIVKANSSNLSKNITSIEDCSEQKLRNGYRRSLKRRDNSVSPRIGPIKRPSISLKRSVSQSPVHQTRGRTPIHAVESTRSSSPTTQSIRISTCGRTSNSPSRSSSSSLQASLSRSRRRSTTPSTAQTSSSHGKSGRHPPRRSRSVSSEESPAPRSMSRSPPSISISTTPSRAQTSSSHGKSGRHSPRRSWSVSSDDAPAPRSMSRSPPSRSRSTAPSRAQTSSSHGKSGRHSPRRSRSASSEESPALRSMSRSPPSRSRQKHYFL